MNPSRAYTDIETLAESSPAPLSPEQEQQRFEGPQGLLAIRVLWEQRKLVGKIVIRGTLLAVVIAFLIPATYESQTQLMPPDQRSSGALSMMAALAGSSEGTGGAGAAGGALSMFGDLLGMRSSGALFISILKSDTVRDRLIDRFDLRRVYWVSTYKGARKKLSSRSDISEDRKSGVISITVTDRNRDRAAAMARAYVDELNQMVVELNTSGAHRERLFLEDRLRVVKQELDQRSKEFSEFASKNTAIDIKVQGTAMVEAAAALQGQLIAAQSELEGLEQIYTSNNVRVRALMARIDELQIQLKKIAGSPADAMSDKDLDQTYPTIRQLPVLGVPYANLYRQVKIDETVYEILTKEYELARIEEAKEVPSVKVIDIAKPPERRSGPPRMLIVIAGALLSLCFASAWLFGREAWQRMDPQEPRRVFVQEVGETSSSWLRKSRAGAVWRSIKQRFLSRSLE